MAEEKKELRTVQVSLTEDDKVEISVINGEVTYESVYVMIDGLIASICKDDMNDRLPIALSFVEMYKAQQHMVDEANKKKDAELKDAEEK